MNIQWFPGHMTKALRLMEDSLKAVDTVGYVLDARAPGACLNPSFERIIGNKTFVFIINKCDLADESKIDKWRVYLEKKGHAVVKINAVSSGGANALGKALFEATKRIREKYSAKGVFKPVRAMIIGVPNCGKSTVINCLYGKKATVTGDRPGVTKGKQWVRLQNGLELLDTPGTLWPKFENDKTAARLAFIGSIKDDILDVSELAAELLVELKKSYPGLLAERYGDELVNTVGADMLESIAYRRGYILKGGQADTERTAKAVLDDFRKGKIGKITLDEPGE